MNNSVFEKLTSKNFLRSILIIHLAMLMGQTLFGILVYIMNKDRSGLPVENDLFVFIVPFVVGSGFILSNFIFRKKLEALSFKESLKEKLADYRTALIMRYTFLQGPSLFGIVTYLLTGNLLFLLLSGLLIMYFIYIRPSRDKITGELNLTHGQSAVFNNPAEVIES